MPISPAQSVRPSTRPPASVSEQYPNDPGGCQRPAAVTSRLYGIANFRAHERLVRTDVQTPGYMRAPFEHIACFAFESIVDELAYTLDQDPVALRRLNDTAADTITGL